MDNNLELDWNVRLSNVERDEEKYRQLWGDEYLWTSMLPLAWSSIDITGISIRPRKRAILGGDSYESAIAHWSMAIHLLGLGMGWTDIGQGLRKWKEHGLREGHHPILDFLLRNFDDQIEALEVYFGIADRAEIAGALAAIKAGDFRGHGVEARREQFTSEYEFQLREFIAEDRYGKMGFAKLLLDGGTDPLHLDSHCAASFRDTSIDMMGMESRSEQGNLLKIWTPYYGGWAERLAGSTREYKTDEFLEDDYTLVEIDIQGIGHIGTFAWGGATSRWFRYSRRYEGSGNQFESHCWGN